MKKYLVLIILSLFFISSCRKATNTSDYFVFNNNSDYSIISVFTNESGLKDTLIMDKNRNYAGFTLCEHDFDYEGLDDADLLKYIKKLNFYSIINNDTTKINTDQYYNLKDWEKNSVYDMGIRFNEYIFIITNEMLK